MSVPKMAIICTGAVAIAGIGWMCQAAAPAGWKVETVLPEMELEYGGRQVTKKVSGRMQAELRMVIFDESQCQLRVARNGTRRGAKEIGVVASEAGAIAACNGGYFHGGSDFAPTGLEVANGERAGTFEPPGPYGGALVVRKGVGALTWDQEFKDEAGITDYVHCNPFLVNDGKPWMPLAPELEDVRAPRTFIATDGRGRWAIGMISRIGLVELADLLLTPDIIPGLNVKRALNLDGGPSSSLWWRDRSGKACEESSGVIVRNYVLVVPRSRE